ncbi:hypothetical protein H311_00675 [Anncaliia algerae PRA109]|nr:hypothetical protein H311_00675 [Anncaliia algerae PRA109]
MPSNIFKQLNILNLLVGHLGNNVTTIYIVKYGKTVLKIYKINPTLKNNAKSTN